MTRTRTVHGGFPLRPLLLSAVLICMVSAPSAALGAGWTGQQDVSTLTHTQQTPTPQIGVDSAGDAFVAVQADKSPKFTQIATRPAGAGFTTTQNLGSTVLTTGGPALAVDPAGHALVVYVGNDTTA